MISFRSFSLVISIVLLRQAALQTWGADALTATSVRGAFNSLICGCVFFCVAGKFLPVVALLRADSVRRDQAWREMEQQRSWLEWLWLVCQGWLLANTGAAHALADAEHAGWPPAVMMFAWFVPTFVFLAALEFGYTQLECMWSIDGDQSSQAHWQRWQSRVRLGVLGHVITCLAPVLILLAAVDVIHYTLPELSELWRGVLALSCLGLIGLTLAPLWLRLWNGAKAVPHSHPVSERLHHLCQQMHIAAPNVCSIDQGKGWHGVALVGWTPLFRQLWISDSVIQSLTAEQLDMVLLHELAHLKRGHCWWRIIPLLIVGIACVFVLTSWELSNARGLVQLLASLVFALGMIWMLGVISRQCEMDADRQACFFAAQHCLWADGQSARAMTTLAAALNALRDPHQHPSQLQWLHPSTTKRVATKL